MQRKNIHFSRIFLALLISFSISTYTCAAEEPAPNTSTESAIVSSAAPESLTEEHNTGKTISYDNMDSVNTDSFQFYLDADLKNVKPGQSYLTEISVEGLTEGKKVIVTLNSTDPELNGFKVPITLEPAELIFTNDGVQYVTVTVDSAEGITLAGTYTGQLSARAKLCNTMEE